MQHGRRKDNIKVNFKEAYLEDIVLNLWFRTGTSLRVVVSMVCVY
jgi:hypothetical protein